MIFLTSDIHGKTDSLMTLLEKAKFFENKDNILYILGDVIDRHGKGGIDLLRWMMTQPNVRFICGNHELMMIENEWLISEVTDEMLNYLTKKQMDAYIHWQQNGGDVTMATLTKLSIQERIAIFDYIKDSMLYDKVSVNGQNYLLVHSGLGGYEPSRPMDDYSVRELVWTRPNGYTRYSDDFITVFGHTPTGYLDPDRNGRIVKTETWWDIDTGASGTGHPMLICLDTLEEFYIE